MRHTFRSGLKLTDKRGTAVIEYAIILPALAFCVLGVMDVGRIFWASATLNRAVASAARCGGVAAPDCNTTAEVKSKTVAEAWNISLQQDGVDVAKQACGIRVTANYPFSFSVPGISPITLTSSSCYAGELENGCGKH